MKLIFHKYIVPFFMSTIVFILTLMKGKTSYQEDWSPTVYGHFFPIFQDGPNSLSIQVDIWKFVLDIALFYGLSLLIFNSLKLKLNKIAIIILSITFAGTIAFSVLIISFHYSLTKINYFFDFSTIKSIWL